MNTFVFRPAVALLAAALLFTASASAAPRIGVLLKGRTDFWTAVEKGCVAAAPGGRAEVTAKMPPSESDIDVQIRMLDALVAQGIDALVIAPCSTTALSGPVAAVAAKGVKIVVIDTPLEGEMPAFIATNHTAAGAAAGKLLASLVADTDEVSILKHSRTSGATTLREVSAFAELRRAHPGLVIHRDIFSGTVAGREVEQARRLLTEHPRTGGILASGTPGSMAMLRVLQESGHAGRIRFVGFGFNLNPTAAAALENGTMDGWIAQLPGEIGARAINAALALLQDRPVAEVSFCDFLVITRANLHEPRVQALLSQ
ncbi:substrate-binding domain-containing protein [Opitutus sp. ER46]|uniref:substrate-binding domain-containing protein n=1 Tax=Opitutus sp. ER46 TaxID=2161864 RepID=UPI000D302013|nr:substrate-binding domain-containing protein [Opitutus sp. ER46]PTX91748.1 hypothetical protein DB354_17970 [Opitutus sp. ER46]